MLLSLLASGRVLKIEAWMETPPPSIIELCDMLRTSRSPLVEAEEEMESPVDDVTAVR